MIPKRKLIRKHHRVQHQEQNQLIQNDIHEGILDKLKSVDSNAKQEAIALLANLTFLPQHLQQPQIIITLINYLYHSDLSLTHSTLFAINNICLIRQKTITQLFEFGFDKALMQLNTSTKELFTPVLILMTTLCNKIPKQYQYLITGVQNTVGNVKNLQIQNYQLVLQFLSQSKYVVKDAETIKCLQNIVENDNKFKNRSLSMKILLISKNGQNQQSIIKKLVDYLNQILQINLQKQYYLNIEPKIKNQEIEQIEMVDEQIPKTSDNQKLPQNTKTAYDIFIDTVQGLQYILQALVDINQQWEEQDSEDDDQQEIQQKNIINVQCQLSSVLDQIFIKNIKYLQRHACATFLDGCLITELTLRLLLKMRVQSDKELQHFICRISINCILTTMKLNNLAEISSANINLALQILLKYKLIEDRSFLIVLLEYLKLDKVWKQCWLSLLELISLYFNPEKMLVSKQQNFKIGFILKKVIIELPYSQLQEWRGQTIDTLFDVYSNENFDNNFMELGFINILEHILNQGNKQKVKKNKKNKFISQVLADIHRFLIYKKQMIKI